MTNRVAVSTAPLAKFEDELPYGLLSTLRIMKRILEKGVVDGFELLYKPEWDGDPPLSQKDRIDYTAKEVLVRLQKEHFPILSVHARKDIGVYLCSKHRIDFEKGKRLLHDSLVFAEALDAGICVFHLWDTFSTCFDLDSISDAFQETTSQFPRLRASVENIPTLIEGRTPFDLVRNFKYLTLDTRWAAVYNEPSAFEPIISKIVNVHLRGELRGEKWLLDSERFDFYGILEKMRKRWSYSGLLTLEPDGQLDSLRFDSFLKALLSLRQDESTL